jgi:hypothetical protein
MKNKRKEGPGAPSAGPGEFVDFSAGLRYTAMA